MTASKTLKNGTTIIENITTQFVDPSKDAFIPYNGTSKDDKAYDVVHMRRLTPDAVMDAIKIKPHTYDVKVGDDIEGVIEFNAAAFAQGDLIQFNMKMTLENS